MLFVAFSLVLASTCPGSKLSVDSMRLIICDSEPFIFLVIYVYQVQSVPPLQSTVH